MKNTSIIMLIAIVVTAFNNVSAQVEVDSSKTTFYTLKNKVVVWEDDKEVKVQVFSKNDTAAMKTIYEGIFTDGKEYERYTVNHTVDWGLSLLGKKKKHKRYRVNPHWQGLGWGFTTVTDGKNFNDINGITLKTERSNEFFINIDEIAFPLYKNHFMIYTGFGVSWKNFHFDNNTHLVEENDITTLQPAPAGIVYKKSRLRVFSVNAPLAFEFQQRLGHRHSLYISAGIVAGVNLFRSQKVKYENAEGKTIKKYNKGFNVSRFSFEFMGQIGLDNVGIFVKYSPMSLFEQGKGADVQIASMGLMFRL